VRARIVPILTFVAAVAAAGAMARAGLTRRFEATAAFHNFAGDGWQYFHLAEQLVKDKRYAFAPSPVPLASSRLPGYPVFLAWVGKEVEKFDPDKVAELVLRKQAWIDLLTALVAFLIAREVGLRAAPWMAFALCLASPFLVLAVCYLLTETIATFLYTTTLWLLLRACRTRPMLHLGLAGALLGIGMLVRADAITLLPCFGVPLLFAKGKRRDKLGMAAAAALAALVCFSPWPLRNWKRFHALRPTGAEWVTKAGDPLTTGPQAWLRTWVVDPEEAAHVAWSVTRSDALWSGYLTIDAWDTVDEKLRMLALFDDWSRVRLLTPELDRRFTDEARARRARDPWRYWIQLPWKRAKKLWLEPVPEWELPAAIRPAPEPKERLVWPRLHKRSVKLALAGLIVLLLFRRGRPLAALAATAAAARTVAIVFVVPGGTQRYLFEIIPLLLVLAAVALVGPAELILRRLSQPAPDPEGRPAAEAE
jgi:4-amino-4-deoxy-L-arabinose transferase-like glycosyltransferase